MNNKNKKFLFIIIAVQILLLVAPACFKSVNQYITEKNAPEKGGSFTFLASYVWLNDDELYLSSHLTDDYYEYVPSHKKLQLTVNEEGYATGTEYKGENDFYVYGRYASVYIPLEKLSFCEGYDLQKLDTVLSENDNITELYISGLDYGNDQLVDWFGDRAYLAVFTAKVYKGVIVPEALYINGVKILDIDGAIVE